MERLKAVESLYKIIIPKLKQENKIGSRANQTAILTLTMANVLMSTVQP